MKRTIEISLRVKGICRIGIREILIVGMFGQIEFVGEERTNAADLQNTLAAVHRRQLVLRHEFYAATGRDVYKDEALRVEALLTAELRSFMLLNHDVGFMYLLSTGAHDRLIGDAQAYADTLHAATLLAGRFNPTGFIRAWPQADRAGYAIIDCMMNLSLLYWASEKTGDPRFEAIARIHADTTIREFIREDGSSNHIVIFDPKTGRALEKPGGQGYAPGSSWSRGQAWALYGFTLSGINTGDRKYIDVARKCAKYFIANIREDGLTDCDFRQPKDEERIDNIAGACAACGLLELANVVGGEEAADGAQRPLRGLDGRQHGHFAKVHGQLSQRRRGPPCQHPLRRLLLHRGALQAARHGRAAVDDRKVRRDVQH